MKNQNKAYIYAFMTVIIWSTVASAFKISLQHLDFLQLLFFSSFVSLIALFLIIVSQGKISSLIKSSKKDYLHSALGGFLNPFIYYIFLFKAYALLPAQEAQPLNYTWPIMLILLSIPLLKQKISLKSLLAICISFFGVFVISTHGNILAFHFSNLNGALLALCTAVIWAMFWILNIKDKRDELIKLFLNFFFGFVYIAIATAVFSKITIPNPKALLGASYVGLFEMGITFVIWAKALNLSETTAKVSRFIYLTPFLSLIVIHFTVGEEILPSTIVGLVFIVLGIIIEQVR
jgi:drug/metabolite transporter (DMT)-like permease